MTRTAAAKGRPWLVMSTGNHQGLIVDEAGNNIAVAYDKANAALIAAAPTMLSMLNENEAAWNGEEESVKREHRKLILRLKAVIAEAEGQS